MVESIGEKVKGKHCDGIAGIEEGKNVMEEPFEETAMDACLVAGGQRAEYYEMPAYGTLIAWGKATGHDAVVRPAETREWGHLFGWFVRGRCDLVSCFDGFATKLSKLGRHLR